MAVLFVNEKTIKAESIIEENTESKLVMITLKEVQDLELYPILGEKLYKELETEVRKKNVDNSYKLPEHISTLLNRYIKDFLVYGVLLNIPTSLNFKYTNKGIKTLNDGNANNVTSGESVKRYYRSKFDSYRLRLLEYVKGNCGVGTVNIAPYSTGWYLPNRVNAQKIVTNRANKLGRY